MPKFTQQEDDYIRANYLLIPTKRISKLLGRSESSARQHIKLLGLSIPKHIIAKFKADSYIKKGATPPNKGKKQSDYMTAEQIERTKATRFKKGVLPHNTKYDGAERITKDGYVEVRISKGVYKLKHRVEWEKVNPPIGDNILTCKSEDKTNCHPDNWKMITRAEHVINNSDHDNPTDKRIASYIATTSKKMDRELQAIVLQHPQIIDTKRTQLLLNRKIKTLTTNQQQHGTK